MQAGARAVARQREAEVLRDERAVVAGGRGRPTTGPWIGLALSGGGIRSATFCLGALQRFAHSRLLRHFDYISSVSGGGYVASAVQWRWHDDPTTDADGRFPYGLGRVKTRNRGALS
jgi:predicted acylesterase/phospholipase RssA